MADDTPWYTALGNVMQQAFPTINAVRTGIAAAPAENLAKGDYARAAGNLVGAAAAYPIAAVNDVVGRPVGTVLHAVTPFLGGIVGSTGSSTDATPIAPPTPAAAVSSAMAQGRAAAVVPAAAVTPQGSLGDALTRVLGRNPSISDIAALGGLVPAAQKPVQTAKDQIFGATAQLSGAIYQKEVEDAAKANPVGTPEYAKAFQKATDNYFQRNASLISNPARLAQAELLQPNQDQ